MTDQKNPSSPLEKKPRYPAIQALGDALQKSTDKKRALAAAIMKVEEKGQGHARPHTGRSTHDESR